MHVAKLVTMATVGRVILKSCLSSLHTDPGLKFKLEVLFL